jgi:hypothetical protein
MLDSSVQHITIDNAWSELGCRVALPEDLVEFMDKEGPVQAEFFDRRQFRRFYYRHRIVMERRGELFCVYTKDISRCGVVLLHAEQIFPCEEVRIFLPNSMTLLTEIRRCRRLQETCYECGAQIIDSTASSGLTM